MRDIHLKTNNFLHKIKLHQFNSLKVHNLNAKIKNRDSNTRILNLEVGKLQ